MKSLLYLVSGLSYFMVISAKRSAKVHGGIVLNVKPRPEQMNYVVGLKIKESMSGLKQWFVEENAICTGGIIHEKYILTAAHCFTKDGKQNKDGSFTQEFRKLKVTVVANATNLFEKSMRVVKVKAKKVYFLPAYLKNGQDDIAILELEEGLTVTKGLFKILQLPRPSIHGNPPGTISSYENTVAILAAYGTDKIGKNDNSLKMAHMRVIDPSKCLKYKGFHGKRDMCVVAVTEKNQNPDTPLGGCQGDSGAPLVDGNTVIGVFQATGNSCDAREDVHPQVYTRVSYYEKFIYNVIRGSGKGTAFIEFDL